MKLEYIEQLIKALYNFVQCSGVAIKTESFENITISMHGSLDILENLKNLYPLFTQINSETPFLLSESDETGSTAISLEEIEENIKFEYYDFSWQISFNKITWFHIDSQTITAFFSVDEFKKWLDSINAFNSTNEFLKFEKLQIVLPMYEDEKVLGESFLLSKTLESEWEGCAPLPLPCDIKVKEFVHVISSDSITFSPSKFRSSITDKNKSFSSLKNIHVSYAESLLATLVQVFYSENKVVLKGLKHITTALNDSDTTPSLKLVSILEKVVLWVYEENTATRLQLIADRLSFHEHNEKSLMQIALNHLEEAFVEAKDRYKFIVTEKSEEYTKDLRDLLKDTKDKAEKYSEKTRNIISSLLRDILGSIFFLGLTVYSRFSSKEDFIISSDAKIIFILLGIYFLLSMLFQASFNFWDIYLSQKESDRWTKSAMDYMTAETYDSYVTKPLNTRSQQIIIIQLVIVLIYIALALTSFYSQNLAQKYLITKQISKTLQDCNITIDHNSSCITSTQEEI